MHVITPAAGAARRQLREPRQCVQAAYRTPPAARLKKNETIESAPRFERIASLAEALTLQASYGAYGPVASLHDLCEALFTVELAAIGVESADKPLTVVGAAGVAELRIAAIYAREMLVGEQENDRLFRRRALDARRAALLQEAS